MTTALDTQILDVARIRADFPILQQQVHGKPLVYLDNAATAQKPLAVIEAMDRYYQESNANIHRGVHHLSEQATELFEGAREQIRTFINARSHREIVFVRGTTEAINLVAQSYGRDKLQAGDEIIISEMEHHSNIVPWQLLCQQMGVRLRVIPVNERGEIELDEYRNLLNERTKLVAVGHVSNALGTINPVKAMIELAHTQNVPVLLDGAQAAPHMKVDVQELDCDFYALSGHKVYGPTGIGVLYGKAELLDAMPPYQGGGDMIKVVSFEHTEYNDLPHKFEAGTPDIAGGIGLGAALAYIQQVGIDKIAAWEDRLLQHATTKMEEIPGLRIIGTAHNKASVVSFVVDGAHAQDIGTLVDQLGVAIRTGHHCAMPVMHRFGVNATARASFAMYNTLDEVDTLVAAIERVREMLI